MNQGKKSTLMTPDPYHIPGYLGYVPQCKYRIGNTFGSITHELLTDNNVSCSGNPVLGDTSATRSPPAKTKEDFQRSQVYTKTRSWGNQKYVPQMVPGYTGYIPQGLNHFGSRYAEICHNAVSSFDTDQKKHEALANDIRTLNRLQADPNARPYETMAQNTTPLKPIADKAKPYLPGYAKQHSISPFYMPDNHPQQYFLAGYTGFVPKARKFFGQSYPSITSQALQAHKGDQERLSRTWNDPVTVFKSNEKKFQTSTIYPTNTGLVPHYTGHIPDQKFKFGTTFGSSTRAAVSQITN